MSKFIPTYDTFFRMGEDGVTHSSATDLPVSDNSFVAFKFPVSELYEIPNPEISISVTVTSTNLLGNDIGMLGLYELSDSNWIGSDPYSKVAGKMNVSPLAVSRPIADHDCDGQVDDDAGETYEKNPVVFRVPANVVRRWKRCNLAQVSMALDTFREFETGGMMNVGSNESGHPIEIEISGGSSPLDVPLDIIVTPSIVTPGGRMTVTIADGRTFDTGIGDLSVTFDGEYATILSGDSRSLKVSVPSVPGKTEGMSEVVVLDFSGAAISATCPVYYDSSATRRVRYFSKPDGRDTGNAKMSRSAVYNRDIGFIGFSEITDENSLVQNIYSILLTRKGERLFNAHFGTTIEGRVFSIMNEDDETAILQECFSAINEYEPRVSVDYDQSRVEVDYESNTARVIIAVVLPSGNCEHIVLPFKNRGVVSR